jgi:hypothetical protein
MYSISCASVLGTILNSTVLLRLDFVPNTAEHKYAHVYSVMSFKYTNALLSLASRSHILRILVCVVYFILSNTKQLTASPRGRAV